MTITDPRPAIPAAAPTVQPLAGPDSISSHPILDAQSRRAADGQDSPQAMSSATPSTGPPAGTKTSHGQRAAGAQTSHAVAAHPGQPAASKEATPIAGALLADPLLALAADVLDDLETVRVANENRLRQLTRTTADSDGQERGFGLDDSHPDVARLAALVQLLGDAEHMAQLNLKRMMRAHPLGQWVSSQKGVGEQQAARLLAAIGDPYWNDLHGRPRTVSELWAFCGFHVLHPGHHASGSQDRPAGVAPRRQRGQQSNWSDTARKRTWLIAAKCIMFADSPYRPVYDATRAKYADATHQAPCLRCGPKGKPADTGSDLSDGHKHARALRAVAKEILRDLWREARAIHQSP